MCESFGIAALLITIATAGGLDSLQHRVLCQLLETSTRPVSLKNIEEAICFICSHPAAKLGTAYGTGPVQCIAKGQKALVGLGSAVGAPWSIPFLEILP